MLSDLTTHHNLIIPQGQTLFKDIKRETEREKERRKSGIGEEHTCRIKFQTKAVPSSSPQSNLLLASTFSSFFSLLKTLRTGFEECKVDKVALRICE